LWQDGKMIFYIVRSGNGLGLGDDLMALGAAIDCAPESYHSILDVNADVLGIGREGTVVAEGTPNPMGEAVIGAELLLGAVGVIFAIIDARVGVIAIAVGVVALAIGILIAVVAVVAIGIGRVDRVKAIGIRMDGKRTIVGIASFGLGQGEVAEEHHDEHNG
jgi:hypothetical protein